MPHTFRVALLGFSEFERSTMASYFRLAAQRDLGYELVGANDDSDFILADADHAPSVQLVVAAERLRDTVFIGSQAPADAVAWTLRPIDPMQVVRELDALRREAVAPAGLPPAAAADEGAMAQAALDGPGASADDPAAQVAPAAEAPAEPEAASESEVLRNFFADETASAGEAAASAEPDLLLDLNEHAQPWQAVPDVPLAAPVAGPPCALIVDDSAVALRFLASRLEPWGLTMDCVVNSMQALECIAERDYDFIFLDVELGAGSDLDGLALCQRIKREHPLSTATLVIVSAHHRELDRVRGSLAGCDAYLAKPLQAVELARLLARRGLKPPPAAAALLRRKSPA